jgi:hypothetical protein
MQASPHDCCKPATPDHCGTHNSQKQCIGHSAAFESSAKIEVGQPIVGVNLFLPVAASEEAATLAVPSTAVDLLHPPPDRCLLNSVLLI